MDNKQYKHLVADIRTMCHCTEVQAKYIVTLCTRLNADARKFVEQLPRLMGTAKPSVDEIIAEMEKVAVKNGVQTGGLSMPTDYENRAVRRRNKRLQQQENRKR